MITVYPKRIDELPLEQLSPFHRLCKVAVEQTREQTRLRAEKRSAQRLAREAMSEGDLLIDFTSNPSAGSVFNRS